jgi:hypothetical protein
MNYQNILKTVGRSFYPVIYYAIKPGREIHYEGYHD